MLILLACFPDIPATYLVLDPAVVLFEVAPFDHGHADSLAKASDIEYFTKRNEPRFSTNM